MYLGFFALSGALGGEALQSLTGLPIAVGTILLGAITAVMAIFGYDLIHAYQRYLAVVFLIAFVVFTIAVAMGGQVPAAAWAMSGFNWGTFLLGVTISVTWQITYAPYVSDYSRYLPKDIGVGPTFNTTFWGTVVASVWMMVLGAALTEVSEKLSTVGVIQQISGGLGWLMMIIILLGIIAANVLNNYGGMLTIDTVAGTFSSREQTSSGTRVALIIGFAVVGIVLGIIAAGNFNADLTNFITFLTYLVVPWTAINLTDFYLVRHGHYDPEAFFRPQGYGGSNWLALGTFVLAVLVEIPFINSTLYEGPFAKALGGADISWILGLIVAGGLYLAFSGNRRVAA